MRLLRTTLLAATSLLFTAPILDFAPDANAAVWSVPIPKLREARVSPLDLEVGGELAGLPAGTTRYISHDDLMSLPQTTYTVMDDPNFTRPTQITGVPLEDLFRALGASSHSDLIVAICSDEYRANYPPAYIAAHHPLLVLSIDGKPPSGWPKDAEGHGSDMGPYMISHSKFTPSFTILAHRDEPQIPWGVVRLEFRNARNLFGMIAPHGPHAVDAQVQDGYRIAQQNCFRCHNMGDEGGHKAGRPWQVLSAWATASPEYLAAYVRNPQANNARAQMPGNPGYDDATVSALISYFQTFSSRDNPAESRQDKP
jgi:mono/diheme cytochrome c family protein